MPVVIRKGFERLAAIDTRVVDQDVERAMLLFNRSDAGCDRRRIRNVERRYINRSTASDNVSRLPSSFVASRPLMTRAPAPKPGRNGIIQSGAATVIKARLPVRSNSLSLLEAKHNPHVGEASLACRSACRDIAGGAQRTRSEIFT